MHQVMQKEQINIAILGTVSAGKSTMLNALLANQLSEMAIRRTTALPHIYHVADHVFNAHEDHKDEEVKEIKDAISKNDFAGARKQNAAALESSAKFDMSPLEFNVQCDLFEDCYKPAIHKVSVWDMPGINDAAAEATYREYVSTNFHRWDTVVLVIDVRSALNTSGEISVVQLVLDGVVSNYSKGILTSVIVAINKCDDMVMVDECPQPDNAELREIVAHIDNTIKRIYVSAMQNYPSAPTPITICVTAELAFVYRALVMNRDSVDSKYLDRFGRDAFGKMWNLVSDDKRGEKIDEIIQSKIGADGLELTGFNSLRRALRQCVSNAADQCWHLRYEARIVREQIMVDTLTDALATELIALHQRCDIACGGCSFVCESPALWKNINHTWGYFREDLYDSTHMREMIPKAVTLTKLMQNLLRLPPCFSSAKFPSHYVGKHLEKLYEKILINPGADLATMKRIIGSIAKFSLDNSCVKKATARIYEHVDFAVANCESRLYEFARYVADTLKYSPEQELNMIANMILYSFAIQPHAKYLWDPVRRREVDMLLSSYCVMRECEYSRVVYALRIVRGAPLQPQEIDNLITSHSNVAGYLQGRHEIPLEERFMQLLETVCPQQVRHMI